MNVLIKEEEKVSYVYKDIPIPQAGKGELLVKVLKVSLCGSDIILYEWNEGNINKWTAYRAGAWYFQLVIKLNVKQRIIYTILVQCYYLQDGWLIVYLSQYYSASLWQASIMMLIFRNQFMIRIKKIRWRDVPIGFCPRVPRLPPSPFSVKFCFVFEELSSVAIYIACKCPAPFFVNFRIRPRAV